MLRRKTIIVLVITVMVTVLVSAFSYLYISQIMRLRISGAYETATNLTHQLAYAAENAVPFRLLKFFPRQSQCPPGSFRWRQIRRRRESREPTQGRRHSSTPASRHAPTG